VHSDAESDSLDGRSEGTQSESTEPGEGIAVILANPEPEPVVSLAPPTDGITDMFSGRRVIEALLKEDVAWTGKVNAKTLGELPDVTEPKRPNITHEVTESITDSITGGDIHDTPYNIPNPMTGNFAIDAAKSGPDHFTNNIVDKDADNTVENTTNVDDSSPDYITNKAVDKITGNATGNVADYITDNTTTVADSDVDHLTKIATDSITDIAVGNAGDHITDNITDNVANTITDGTADCIAKNTSEDTSENITENISASTTESTMSTLICPQESANPPTSQVEEAAELESMTGELSLDETTKAPEAQPDKEEDPEATVAVHITGTEKGVDVNTLDDVETIRPVETDVGTFQPVEIEAEKNEQTHTPATASNIIHTEAATPSAESSTDLHIVSSETTVAIEVTVVAATTSGQIATAESQSNSEATTSSPDNSTGLQAISSETTTAIEAIVAATAAESQLDSEMALFGDATCPRVRFPAASADKRAISILTTKLAVIPMPANFAQSKPEYLPPTGFEPLAFGPHYAHPGFSAIEDSVCFTHTIPVFEF